MSFAEWARRERVHPQTAYRWFREGTLPEPARRVGPRLILVEPDEGRPSGGATVIIYARVSHDQRQGLDSQVGRVAGWASKNGVGGDRVVTEVGSGLNGKPRRLHRLLADPSVGTIVVEHRDRLAGGEGPPGADVGETTDDVVGVIEVLTSMRARLYGRLGARNRAETALRCAERDVGPSTVIPPGDNGW